VDVRVLAATNRDPEEAVRDGKLRQDLFFRLNVFHLHLSPLRQRSGDVPLLTDTILKELNTKNNRQVARVSRTVMARFEAYSWPGNVRELRNTLERALIVCNGEQIEENHLPPGFGQSRLVPGSAPPDDPNSVRIPVGTSVSEAEKQLILRTLAANAHNKTRTADVLGISLKTLHNKLKEFGAE